MSVRDAATCYLTVRPPATATHYGVGKLRSQGSTSASITTGPTLRADGEGDEMRGSVEVSVMNLVLCTEHAEWLSVLRLKAYGGRLSAYRSSIGRYSCRVACDALTVASARPSVSMTAT